MAQITVLLRENGHVYTFCVNAPANEQAHVCQILKRQNPNVVILDSWIEEKRIEKEKS